MNELKQTPYKIYVDMDGVLTDFELQTKKLTGFTPQQLQDQGGDKKMWGEIGKHEIGFWKDMPWMDGSKVFWDFVKKFNPKILSAPSRSIDDCKPGKLAWVKNNLGSHVVVVFARASEKMNYADSESILIDDLQKNIDGWKSKGGLGILFKSPQQVIKELQKLGLK
jgi:hypothetical protein